jgi:hydroxypyruvate isomerase
VDHDRLTLAISLLGGAAPVHSRVERAVEAGYSRLESWWPWDSGVPDTAEVAALAATLDRTGAKLHLLNLSEGNPRWGRRGLAGVPEASREFWDNAHAALAVASRVGVRHLHVLAGNAGDAGRDVGLAVLEERLVRLAEGSSAAGVGLVVELLNPVDHPDYILNTAESAIEVVEAVRARGGGEVGLLADTYHLARSGLEPGGFIRHHARVIHHVQFADFPGRGQPGTGEIAFPEVVRALEEVGYAGMVGLEFLPSGDEPNSLPGPADMWRRIRAAPERVRRS